MIKSFHSRISLAYTGLILVAGVLSLCLEWLVLSKHRQQMQDQLSWGKHSIEGWEELVYHTMTETACVVLLILLIGLGVFAMIMRRFDALCHRISRLNQIESLGGLRKDSHSPQNTDQIDQLAEILSHMAELVARQNQRIQGQEQQSRELVANVSHDLRTPLASMQGYLETLLYKSGELSVAEQRRYLEVAVRQSRRAGQRVQSMFELAKLEAEDTQANFEAFCLQELVQDVVQKFKADITLPDIEIVTSFQPDILPVYADIGMIERVLSILIDNALRYTPQTGCIRIKLEYSAIKILVFVNNTGTFIPEEYLSTLFDRNSPLRLAPGKNQNGLGLLIANKIIQLHGSNIQVSSAADSGTTFYFKVPSAKKDGVSYG